MSEEKYIEQKKQRFDNVIFAMTLFCAKKKKSLLADVNKTQNPEIVLKIL